MITVQQYKQLGDEILKQSDYDKKKAIDEVDSMVLPDTIKKAIKIYIRSK